MFKLAVINRGQEDRGREAILVHVKALIVVPNDQMKTTELRETPGGVGQRGGRKGDPLRVSRRKKIRIRSGTS